MARKTWKDSEHHLLPKSIQRKTSGQVWNNRTVPLSGERHVQAHRDIRKYSVIGHIARLDLDEWDDDDDEDDD